MQIYTHRPIIMDNIHPNHPRSNTQNNKTLNMMKTATLLSLAAMASARQLTLIGEVDIDSPKVSNFFDHLVVRHSFWALLRKNIFQGPLTAGHL